MLTFQTLASWQQWRLATTTPEQHQVCSSVVIAVVCCTLVFAAMRCHISEPGVVHSMYVYAFIHLLWLTSCCCLSFKSRVPATASDLGDNTVFEQMMLGANVCQCACVLCESQAGTLSRWWWMRAQADCNGPGKEHTGTC
jgi:hypothetical protein